VSVVGRTVAAIPVRTSVGTWEAITDLLAPAGSVGRSRLEGITNIAAVLITAGYTQQAPIVVMPGNGSRVRIRTVHGLDAEEARAVEIPLTISPCAEPGWILSLPCGVDDIDEIREALRPHPGIEARDVTDGITVDEPAPGSGAEGWSINYDELERP
jgi:hypothetical protein